MLKKKLHQSQLSVLVDEVTRTQSTLLSEQNKHCSQKSIH